MAPRVPKGNHRDPFVKTILPKPTRRGSSQQPLLLSATDYRKALDGHDAPLSTCYLFFISFFFYACGASLVMIQNVLLPAQMATAASREHVDKSTALGICSSIASATQLLQPPVGALADVANGRYRKVWLAFGQLICAVGCIGLLVGSSTMQLSVAMTVCMLGSSIGWGVYLCIIPDYVPEAQHGVASGIQGFMAIAGTISGSAIGYAHGNGWLSSSYVYWFCAIINVLVGVFGWVALSGQRNHRPPKKREVGGTNESSPFLSGFRHTSFTALFVAITISSLGPMFMGTFLQYYLKDRVAPHGFKLFGRSLATSAESATAVMTTVSGIASQISVLPGGTLTARLGGRSVLALSFCVGAASLTAYAFTTDFAIVLGLAALNGLGGGLQAGAIGAVSAATLPDVENSARDMNILVTGPVFGQMALQAGGGYVISWASKKWSPAVAWSVMWLVSGAFFLLAVPTLIPIRPAQSQVRIQEKGEEMKAYRKPHDYRRGGMGGRY